MCLGWGGLGKVQAGSCHVESGCATTAASRVTTAVHCNPSWHVSSLLHSAAAGHFILQCLPATAPCA